MGSSPGEAVGIAGACGVSTLKPENKIPFFLEALSYLLLTELQ